MPKITMRGFSLVELLVSLGVGLLVLGTAVGMYSNAVKGTWDVSQRAEMQQDARAAANLLLKDISLAGAGLPSGGLALPSGTAIIPVYGCDQAPKCYIGPAGNNAIAYPLQGATPYLYGIIPGWKQGITVSASQGPSDIITIVYTDDTFLLNCYNVSFTDTSGTSVNFSLPDATHPRPCALTPPQTGPQNVTDAALGLTPGDLVLFQGKNASGNTAYAVAEVSNATGAASPFNVTFNNGDPLKMNQTAATSNNLTQIDTAANTILSSAIASRLFVITYYLDLSPYDGTTPRLMRQVNGHTPVPVDENVAFMAFSYDTYATNGTLLKDQPDGGESSGVSPSLIRKINILHFTKRSQLSGTSGYQGFDLQTSISARDMSFQNRYQ